MAGRKILLSTRIKLHIVIFCGAYRRISQYYFIAAATCVYVLHR